MALLTAVGSFNIGTGAVGSTVSVETTDPVAGTFQPKLIRFEWNGLTAASNGGRLSSRRGHGFAFLDTETSTLYSECPHINWDGDALGTSVAKVSSSTTACVATINNAATPAIDGAAFLKTLNANGFTLEIADVFPVNLIVNYIAIGGDDITNVALATITPAGTVPNQQSNTTLSFQPDFAFFWQGVSAGAGSRFMLGAATGASNQAVWWGGANDAAATGATGSYCRNGECFVFGLGATGSPTNRASLVSFNSDGFTIQWHERVNSSLVRALCIKGGVWNVGSVLTRTDATQFSITGQTVAPKAAMFISAGQAETVQDAATAAHDHWSSGFANGATSRVVNQLTSRSGNTSMFVHGANRADAVLVKSDPANAAYTLTALMDVVSFNSDGLTLVMDDTDAIQSFVWYATVGPNAGNFQTGVGSSTGDATTTGVGGAIAAGIGSSTGLATVTGVGSTSGGPVTGTGTSTGIAAVSGVGASTIVSIGTSTAAAVVAGAGRSAASGIGAGTGQGTVTGQGASIFKATGTSTGSGTSTGQGASVARGTGASTGSATVLGQGRATTLSISTVSAGATVIGTASSRVTTIGTSNAGAVVTGQGRSQVTGIGTSVGLATVTGLSGSQNFQAGVGTSTGAVIVQGEGRSLATAVGTAVATALINGLGRSTHTGFGTSTSSSIVDGVGRSTHVGLGESTSNPSVVGVGAAFHVGIGFSSGVATVTGITLSVMPQASITNEAFRVNTVIEALRTNSVVEFLVVDTPEP